MKRRFLNPILIVAAGLTIVSGLLVFFHLKSKTVAHVHEVGGLVFMGCCFLHVVMNRKPLTASFKSGLMVKLVVLALLVGSVGMIYSGVTAEPKKKYSRVYKKLKH